MKWRRLWLFLPLLLLVMGALIYVWWVNQLEQRHDPVIVAAARRYNVNPALVKAIVWRESRFNPLARGRAQEIGLMQLREEAAQEWADAERIATFEHEHCVDPATNTLAGTFYLAKLLRRYARTDDPVPYALADYNAGRGNVLKWLDGAGATNSRVFMDQIGFPETRNYITAVVARTGRYRWMARRTVPARPANRPEAPAAPIAQ